MSFQIGLSACLENAKGDKLTRCNTGKEHILTWVDAQGSVVKTVRLQMGLYTSKEMYDREAMLIREFQA